MGEVYRARDTKLNRDVAIKVLLTAVVRDPERIARFSREAQILAALNHPNIAHIHGLEESDRTPALVMELVDGDTLAERLHGALPVDEALAIAKHIAHALEAAHEQGIIHRDLNQPNLQQRESLQRSQDRAHRRYLTAIRCRAAVRRSQLPAALQ